MAIEVRKATRRKVKMRLGIAATAGSGKTMGALLVAYGLTSNWDAIGLIDTEAGSGELYVGHHVPGTTFVIGEYMYCRLSPPFSVAKYMEAQKALEEAGCEVIIHDSISHAWAGTGGLLDKQGKIAAKGGNSYAAWRDVTPEHNAFVEMMLQSPAHIIATMRSKTEYVLETNDRGKQVPRKIGMAPIQREGMDFEFSVMLDIDASHMASATKDRTSLFDGEYFKLSPDVGKKMLGWLNSGAEALPPVERALPMTPEQLGDIAPKFQERPTRPTDAEMLDRIVTALECAKDAAGVRRILTHHEAQHLRDRLGDEMRFAYDAAAKAAEARFAPPPAPARPMAQDFLEHHGLAAPPPADSAPELDDPFPTPEQIRADREAA